MSDAPALIHFYQGWADTGQVGKDGLPVYEDTIMVEVDKPPLTKLNRAAYKSDFTTYREEYEAFKNQQRAKDAKVNEAGYPLVYWPAVTTAEVEMLAIRGIYTVEQLEKYAGNKDLPGRLAELAIRAERMMDMQKQMGKYEAMLADLEAQLAEANLQMTEMRQQLASQNAIIETLKMRVQ